MNENLNPFSSRGRLSFGSFLAVTGVTVLFNVLVFIAIRGHIIAARAVVDRPKGLILYGVWGGLSIAGFAVLSNSFVKRWNAILDRAEPSRFWNGLLRFSLLSPLFSYAITLVTLLYFPQSPLQDARSLRSRGPVRMVVAIVLVLSLVVGIFLPGAWFGVDRLQFRESAQTFARLAFDRGKNPLPSELVLKPIFMALTPGGRYLGWMLADFIRTHGLSLAVEADPTTMCSERLGLFGKEVPDCYFWNLRKMAEQAPLVSPYFALFFEAQYRTGVMRVLASDPNRTSLQGFAADMVMLSNLIELLEKGPLFVERIHFLRPPFLLHAFASPEVPLVEAGQDVQRVSLLTKTIPELERQLHDIRLMLDEVGPSLGAEEVTVRSEYDDLDRRIQALKRATL